MLYFKIEKGDVIEIKDSYPHDPSNTWTSRHDFETFEQAVAIAYLCTTKFNKLYVAIDNSEYVSPRYDVIAGPVVGEKVSYGFNGDYYPDGEITDISKTLKVITTSTGHRYYRKRLTGSWKYNKTWSLVNGHHSEKNPSF